MTLFKKEEEQVAQKPEAPIDDKKADKPRLSRDDKSEMDRLYQRAVALLKRKEPKEAVKTLIQALAIDPDYMDALNELGKLYLDQKMWGKASAIYRTLAEKTDKAVDYSHMGLALYNNSDFDEAALAYQEAISRDPKRHQRYVSLGHVYLDANKLPLALIAFNRAIEFDKENADYLLLAADVHMRLENFSEAKTLLNKAIELAPMGKISKRMLKECESLERKAKRASGN